MIGFRVSCLPLCVCSVGAAGGGGWAGTGIVFVQYVLCRVGRGGSIPVVPHAFVLKILHVHVKFGLFID